MKSLAYLPFTMKQPIIYVDTSVLGGVFDKEFAEHSIQFFERVKAGKLKIAFSNILREELENAPTHVKSFYNNLPKEMIIRVASNTAVE